MEITCSQMDVLISFYIDGDLSKALKEKVEAHLKICPTCRAKYDIVKSMLNDLRNSFNEDGYDNENSESNNVLSRQYRVFQNNLSAYIDNELSPEENIRIKKYTINNKNARKELEHNYNIRKLMSDSFSKTQLGAKQDFSKKILKQLDPNDEYNLAFHPVLKVAAAFVFTVLALTAIIVFSLTL